MISIDTQKLKNLIKAFYNLTGIKVAVYNNNFKEVLAYPLTHSPLCTLVRQNEERCLKCSKSAEGMCRKCGEEKRVIIENCHAGLTEAVAPITDGISVIGYIMFGQITNIANSDKLFEIVNSKCEMFDSKPEELKKALQGISYYSDSQLDDASKILDALAGYIVFSKLLYPSEDDTGRKIVEYIRDNIGEDLSVKTLCKKFYLSKTEIYKVTKPYMPGGIADFIKTERIEKACTLLLQTDMASSMIADSVGFADPDYFLRVFKKTKGMSAMAYRKNYRDERTKHYEKNLFE